MSAPMLPTLSPWADGPMVAFDTETTGVDVETDRIVSAAVVSVGDGPRSEREWLINPGIEIPEAATRIHGITTERVREKGEDPVIAISAITEALMAAIERDIPVVIMNAPYDLTLLDRECRRYSLPTLTDWCEDETRTLHVIDPLVLDRYCEKYRGGKRTLTALAKHYEVPLMDEHAHSAFGDALATVRIAWKISRKHAAKVGTHPLPALAALQGAAHADWAEGFEAYLRKQGKDDVISRDWPIRPYGGAA